MSDRKDRRLLLAVDTANERCSVAVADLGDGTILASADPSIGKGHAERLMDLVAEILAEAGAEYGDVAKLAIGIGPGSFTGIRVAVAAARGWELALGIPGVGVDTLEAQAEPHARDGAVLAVHDARRGEVYAALHAPGGARLAGPEAMVVDDLPAFCVRHGVEPADLRLVGSGAVLAAERLPGARLVPEAGEGSAPIASIVRIALARAPGAPPLPLYLRGADAKVQVPLGLRAVSQRSEPGAPLDIAG